MDGNRYTPNGRNVVKNSMTDQVTHHQQQGGEYEQ